ncbi:uncharacterized protein LOC141863221 [Acropora palmata]|uniref:uncharacterized protein LOC141863221 n=1 Tax=Acropora palmata TaxID=6131 RepID=UPI003DA0B3D2
MTETPVQNVIIIIIANCVFNLALAFVVIFGNASVLYGVWKTPSLRSPSILLLCGLASTDFSVGVIAQPIFIARSFVGLFSRSLGRLLSSTVVFLNSALNPLLYCWRIREISLAVLRTFRKIVSR